MLLKNLEEAGVQVVRLGPGEKAAFAAATRPVYAKIRSGQSADGKQLFDLIEKKIAGK